MHVQLFRLATFVGNRMFAVPPAGLAEYIEGPPAGVGAAAAAATMADVAQPPELRSRLRAVTMNSGADPDLARRMLEGYLTVRESLERREGLYTVIGHAEGSDGTAVSPDGAQAQAQSRGAHASGRGAQASPQAAHGGGGDVRAGADPPVTAASRQSEGVRGEGPGAGGPAHSHDRGEEDAEAGGPSHAYAPENRLFEGEGGAAEASIASELVAMALSSPLLGMLATGALDGQGAGLFGAADTPDSDQGDQQSQ